MATTSDELILKLQQIGADDIAASLKDLTSGLDDLAKTEKKVADSSEKVAKSFGTLRTTGRGLTELGRAFDVFGNIFNNQGLKQLGDYTRGIGEISRSFGDLKRAAEQLQSGGLLGKLTLGAGATLGGAAIGSQIYDATIGQMQGTNTATILNQIQQLIAAGFNVDTLKVQATQAFIQAQQAGQFGALQKELSDIGKSRLDKLGFYTGPKTVEGMTQALKDVEEYLKTAPEHKPAGPGEVEQLNYKLIAQVMAQGLREELTKAQAAENQKKLQQVEQERVQARQQLQNQTNSAANQLGQRISDLTLSKSTETTKYKQALASIEKQAQDQRLQVTKSYVSDLADMEKAYYANRSKAAAQYGLEEQRAEEDHQREMSRMQQDHGRRLRNLAESRDALAIEDEVDNYNVERDRAEEDYNVQAARRNEDFALQLSDMEQSFRDQRDARQRQYQEQMQQISQQARDRYTTETTQYNLLMQTIVTETESAVNQIKHLYDQLNVTQKQDYGGGVSSHAWGGYQDNTGAAYMHAGEFVLNAQTTRAMEAVTGQRLSQTSIMSAMGGSIINLSIPLTVNGTDTQPEVFRSIVHDEVTRIFREAMR